MKDFQKCIEMTFMNCIMRRILLICPALPDDMPYLRQYLDYFEACNILYDVTYLDRGGENIPYPSNYYPFSLSLPSRTTLRKLIGYYKYSRFVKRKLSRGNYSHVITMGIACSVFFSHFLKKNFESKYIFDIRDYSQILRIPLFRKLNRILLKHSYMNVISSNAFRNWLPSEMDYTLSHNITKENLDKGTMYSKTINFAEPIKILTIGQIRDLETNLYVIDQLSDNDKYELIFSGKGRILEYLETVVRERGYQNVKFTGKYMKEEEDGIAEGATFLNVCMGRNMISDYLLSNRLYLATRMKNPLISLDGCYQAEIINNYNLGLVVTRGNNLSVSIEEYIRTFDANLFLDGCERFLNDVRADVERFNMKMDAFVS